MKAMRKLAVVAITFLMVLLTGTLAFASGDSTPETGSITIADPNTSATYKAYKIFDVEVDGNGQMTYTIDESSPWHSVLFDENHVSQFSGIEGNHENTPHTITKLEGFSAEKFAQFLLQEGGDISTTHIAYGQATPSVTISDLEPGYYLVTTTVDGTVQDKAALTNVLAGEDVTVQDKNDMLFDKTVDGVKEEPVHIGQTLNFEIDGKVPSIGQSDTSFTYLITDKMDDGLTFNSESIVIMVGDEQVVPMVITAANASLTGDQIRFTENGFELSLEMFERGKTAAGDDIVITYTADVNEDAASTISVNTAVLEYGNNPQHLLSKDSQTAVYTAKIVIDKCETGAPEQKVKGADFVLAKKDPNDDTKFLYYVATLDDTETEVVNVEWSADEDEATHRVTDITGRAEFRGIEAGTYYLIETQAPTGYTQLTDPVKVVVSTDGVTDVSLTADQVSIMLTNIVHVYNTPGSMMPSTGGIGRTIFFVLAGLLAVDVIVRVIRRRRSSDEE